MDKLAISYLILTLIFTIQSILILIRVLDSFPLFFYFHPNRLSTVHIKNKEKINSRFITSIVFETVNIKYGPHVAGHASNLFLHCKLSKNGWKLNWKLPHIGKSASKNQRKLSRKRVSSRRSPFFSTFHISQCRSIVQSHAYPPCFWYWDCLLSSIPFMLFFFLEKPHIFRWLITTVKLGYFFILPFYIQSGEVCKRCAYFIWKQSIWSTYIRTSHMFFSKKRMKNR